MSFSISISSNRSVKTFRVKRKAEKEDSEDSKDYILENSGDIRKYLFPSASVKSGPRYHNGKIVPYSVIGPTSLFSNKNPEIPIRTTARKKTNASKQLSCIGESKVDYQEKFEKLLGKIKDARNRAIVEEKNEFKKLSNKEKKIAEEQFAIISAKKPPQLEKIQVGPLPNSEIPVKNPLLHKKADSLHDLFWYMSLRGNENSENLETFMRVGNELSGLYTRVQQPNPLFNAATSRKPIKKHVKMFGKEIEVVGKSKLDLEIDAVKKIGVEYLRPELLQTSGLIDD